MQFDLIVPGFRVFFFFFLEYYRTLFLLISKYTKHKITIIRCQSQRLTWRRSESYNVLLNKLQ